PQEAKDRVMHARLTKGGSILLMASDTMPGAPFQPGTNFSMSIACQSEEEADQLFGALAEGGEGTMPLADMFWGGYFGMLKDRYGIHWMLNDEGPKQG